MACRVIHYIKQFYTGIRGEEKPDYIPSVMFFSPSMVGEGNFFATIDYIIDLS